MRKTLVSSLAAVVGLMLLMTGCSTIDGDFNENQPPSVAFVNNQQDADAVAQTYEIEDYTFIFPDRFLGFEEDAAGELPADTVLNVEAKFELIRYQYFNLLEINSITEFNPENGETRTVPVENYRIDENISRYLWIQHTTAFEWGLGRSYIIDGTFEYRPVHSFAPIVFWQGSDRDGFVEFYRVLDHPYVDDTELANITAKVMSNDSSLEWFYTLNTQGTVNLTTELGRIQKHVLFVQAIDNNSTLSMPATRVFNRSNRAPNTPTISYHKDGYTRISQPSEYERHVISWSDIETDINYIADLQDNVSPYYEVPISETPLTNWNGMRFLVSGDDPDDQALLTIPLQYHFILHGIPADSVDTWMDPEIAESESGLSIFDYGDLEVLLDESNVVGFDPDDFTTDFWTSSNQVELFNLDSGFYQLTVFSRDDGLEPCAEPAWIRFKVQKATFDKDILIMNLTPNGAAFLGFDSDEEYVQHYLTLVEEAMPNAKLMGEGVADYQVQWMHNDSLDTGYNCRYWKMDQDADYPYLLPYSVLSQYHSIVVLDDKWGRGLNDGNPNDERIRNPAKGFLMDYLDMGGSLFWTGFSSLVGTFGIAPGTGTLSEDAMSINGGDFLGLYMGVQGVYGDILNTFLYRRGDACTSAIPEFEGFSSLNFIQEKIDMLREFPLYNMVYYDELDPSYSAPAPDSSLVYVEAIALNESIGTTAIYTYESYSAGLDNETTFDFFRVASMDDLPPIFYTEDELNYPGESPWHLGTNIDPGPDGCWLFIPGSAQNFHDIEIFQAFDAINASNGDAWGNPQMISRGNNGGNESVYIYVNHQTGAAWSPGDQVLLDVSWQPILEKHRKPVLCYTENMGFAGNFGGQNYNPINTNFRTAFSAIPLHLVELGELPLNPMDAGTGSRGIFSGILTQFFLPKLQEVVE